MNENVHVINYTPHLNRLRSVCLMKFNPSIECTTLGYIISKQVGLLLGC